jgi:hypothetical protein
MGLVKFLLTKLLDSDRFGFDGLYDGWKLAK